MLISLEETTRSEAGCLSILGCSLGVALAQGDDRIKNIVKRVQKTEVNFGWKKKINKNKQKKIKPSPDY